MARRNPKYVCGWCGKPNAIWSTIIRGYVCSIPYSECSTYKLIFEHKSTCPLPDSYHSTHMSKIKCYKLLYEILASRYKAPERIDMDKLLLRARIQKGEEPCKYCGEPANFYLNYSIPCCRARSPQCPSYKKWCGDIHRKSYEDNPEYGKEMSSKMYEVQNRKSVSEKKSIAMIRLHNENCDECITFQKHYHASDKGPKPK